MSSGCGCRTHDAGGICPGSRPDPTAKEIADLKARIVALVKAVEGLKKTAYYHHRSCEIDKCDSCTCGLDAALAAAEAAVDNTKGPSND